MRDGSLTPLVVTLVVVAVMGAGCGLRSGSTDSAATNAVRSTKATTTAASSGATVAVTTTAVAAPTTAVTTATTTTIVAASAAAFDLDAYCAAVRTTELVDLSKLLFYTPADAQVQIDRYTKLAQLAPPELHEAITKMLPIFEDGKHRTEIGTVTDQTTFLAWIQELLDHNAQPVVDWIAGQQLVVPWNQQHCPA